MRALGVDEGGDGFMIDAPSDDFETVQTELYRVMDLPDDERPNTFEYSDLAALAVMAATANIHKIYELGYDDDEERIVVEINVEVRT